jgi:hypothetical protein
MIDIGGHWIGFYTYDKGYSNQTKLDTIPFRATIKKEFENFVGQIIEEEDFGGIEDEILIKGKLTGRKIEFTKYYALEHVVYEDNQSESFESENPTIVHYEGEYIDNESKFKGRWEIGQLKEDDSGIMNEDNNSGLWEMWRP